MTGPKRTNRHNFEIIYFKCDFNGGFPWGNFLSVFANKSWSSSYCFWDKRGQRGQNKTSTLKDNFLNLSLICVLFSPIEFLWKKSCSEYGNRFALVCTISNIWQDQKFYFNGLNINIGPYVNWIKYLIELTLIVWMT